MAESMLGLKMVISTALVINYHKEVVRGVPYIKKGFFSVIVDQKEPFYLLLVLNFRNFYLSFIMASFFMAISFSLVISIFFHSTSALTMAPLASLLKILLMAASLLR